MTRRALTAATAVALAFGMTCALGACEGTVPTVNAPTSAASATPDLTEAQEQRIRADLLATIKECNDTKDPTNLAQAMSGPELQIRTSELKVAQKNGKLDPKTTIPDDLTQTVIPTDNGWPRAVFSITTTTEDQQSERLLVFTQGDARENYRLWAVTRLFQGTKMPKFTVPSIGSQMGHEDDGNLVMTPKEAVTRYADVLQNGTKSQYASDFGDDYFRDNLAQLSATVQQGMERNKGTQRQTFTPVDGQMQIMRSSDGGDLVVAQIDSVWTRAAGEGRESQPASDAERAIFADGKATSTMKATYVNVVAIYIPPAKSGQKVQAVGAERQVVKVEAV